MTKKNVKGNFLTVGLTKKTIANYLIKSNDDFRAK